MRQINIRDTGLLHAHTGQAQPERMQEGWPGSTADSAKLKERGGSMICSLMEVA
jgi:hypothetical protein